MLKRKWTKGQISLLVRSARVAFDPEADPVHREAARWVADELAREFLPDARKFLMTFSGNFAIDPDDRESMVHDAVLATIQKFDDVSHPDCAFTTLLYWRVRSALSAHMTAYAGRERREGSRNDYLPIEDYSKEVDDGELPAEVDRLADILSRWRKSRDVRKKRMAEVLTARYWDGKIFKEIGRSLGVSKQRTHDIHDDALVLLRTAISA